MCIYIGLFGYVWEYMYVICVCRCVCMMRVDVCGSVCVFRGMVFSVYG